jgi:murein DD-endopeptidase MepM/ murein hydrolase activator NlpD
MDTGYQKQSLFIRKSIQILLVLTLLLIIPHSTQATFAKSSRQQAQDTNLALHKPTTQLPGTHTDEICPQGGGPEDAVDDDTNGDWSHCSVTHTLIGSRPWWRVDLQGIHPIRMVEIWNRTDCCSDRLSQFYVSVSEDGSTWTDRFVGNTAGTPETVTFDPPVSGRYVRIQLINTNWLSLAEVKVFGGDEAEFTASAFKDANGNDVNPVRHGETKSFYVGRTVDTNKVHFKFSASGSSAPPYEWKINNTVESTAAEFVKDLGEGHYDIALTATVNGQTLAGKATINIVPRDGKTTLLNLSWPFIGSAGSSFWHQERQTRRTHHLGDDAYAQDWNWDSGNSDEGMVLLSPADGKVVFAGLTSSNYGRQVSILLDDIPGDDNPGDFVVMFAHLSGILVFPNQTVCAGTPIGRVGNTGTTDVHAHISAWQGVFQLSNTGTDLPGIHWIVQGKAPEGISGDATHFATGFAFGSDSSTTPQGCDANYILQGRITNKTGKVLSNVNVSLLDLAGLPVPDELGRFIFDTTIHNGVYILKNVRPGSYYVQASKAGCNFDPLLVVVTTRHVFVNSIKATNSKGCS